MNYIKCTSASCDECLDQILMLLEVQPRELELSSNSFVNIKRSLQVIWILLLGLAEPGLSARKGFVAKHLVVNATLQNLPKAESEYAFNLAAFYDGRRSLVRIYSELEPKFVKPIELGDLSSIHVNQCHFELANGTIWSTATSLVDTQWAYGDEKRIRTVNKVDPKHLQVLLRRMT